MKTLIIFILSLVGYSISIAQQANSNRTLFIIKSGSKEIKTYNMLISPVDFDDMKQITHDQAANSYGLHNKENVMIVTPMNDIKLLTLNMLFDKYNIDKKYQGYPVFVNDKEVSAPADLIAADNYINTLTVNNGHINIETNKSMKIRHSPQNKWIRIRKLDSK